MEPTSCFSSETEELIPVDTEEAESQEQQASLSQRDSRSLIFHLLYVVESYEYDIAMEEVVDNFNHGFDLSIGFSDDLVQTAQKVVTERDNLDEQVKPLLINWRFDRVGVCTRLILRLALYELMHTDVDTRIIINEAIELAKCFAEKDAYKFVNGILDEVAKKLGRNSLE